MSGGELFVGRAWWPRRRGGREGGREGREGGTDGRRERGRKEGPGGKMMFDGDLA
jgi:hypothetical protein